MDKDTLVRKYISDNPNMSKHGLARVMFKEHPEMFKNEDSARWSIRYRTGNAGSDFKNKVKDKSQIEVTEPNKEFVLKKIAEQYSLTELNAIANGGRLMPGYAKVPIIDFGGQRIRIGAITDTHIGSKYFSPDRLLQAFKEFKKQGVDIVCHGGDVTEGMSNRPGHIYELDQLGYDRQRNAAVEILGHWKGKMFLIDGNHDRWFIKNTGALMVKDIAKMLPNAEFLGHDEGDISLKGKAVLKLWHGEDGSSYAISYRLQKVIESLSGGEKPSVMFFGHTHKSTYLFERNVHCYSLGCVQSQSSWMRGKRISAHTGFWIIDIWVNNSGVSKSSGTFYPFYT